MINKIDTQSVRAAIKEIQKDAEDIKETLAELLTNHKEEISDTEIYMAKVSAKHMIKDYNLIIKELKEKLIKETYEI